MKLISSLVRVLPLLVVVRWIEPDSGAISKCLPNYAVEKNSNERCFMLEPLFYDSDISEKVDVIIDTTGIEVISACVSNYLVRDA